MGTLVERLRHSAERLWPGALAVSNTRRPESDNDFGRAATACKEAADRIEALERELAEANAYARDRSVALQQADSDNERLEARVVELEALEKIADKAAGDDSYE